MNYPHRIRLRGPWQCQALAADGDATLPADHDVAMPGSLRDQGLGRFRGDVLFRRHFGYPGRIDDWERVWLTFDDVAGKADITLNESALAAGVSGRVAFNVTPLLGPRNLLEVVLTAASDQDGLVGEVAMEVRARAFLDDVRVDPGDGSLHVRGRVVGDYDDPLELYAMVDGRHVHYQTTRAATDGAPFTFSIPETSGGDSLVVQLVCRSEIWYGVSMSLGDSAS